MTASPLLDIENLSVTFPEADGPDIHAVDSVDLKIEPGSIHGLVGESGSGKSVTASSIMRLLDNANINADQFSYRDYNLLEKSEVEMQQIRGDEIGMVFQDSLSALNPIMTVGEQVAEVVRHHGDVDESTGLLSELRRKYITGTDTESASWQRAVELLEMVGIPDPEQRAEEYPHQLSGGQRQRVMIAQALGGNPSLIIADEPTTALDVTVEANILQELENLAEEFDIAILLITHDLGVVAETCDTVTVMYSGSVMERAPTEQLFKQPSHPYTRGLMMSIPKYDHVEGEQLATIPGAAPDPADRPSGCPFRDRCPAAVNACTDPVAEHNISDKHISYCHLHGSEHDTRPSELDWGSANNSDTDKQSQSVAARIGGEANEQ